MTGQRRQEGELAAASGAKPGPGPLPLPLPAFVITCLRCGGGGGSRRRLPSRPPSSSPPLAFMAHSHEVRSPRPGPASSIACHRRTGSDYSHRPRLYFSRSAGDAAFYVSAATWAFARSATKKGTGGTNAIRAVLHTTAVQRGGTPRDVTRPPYCLNAPDGDLGGRAAIGSHRALPPPQRGAGRDKRARRGGRRVCAPTAQSSSREASCHETSAFFPARWRHARLGGSGGDER